MGWSEHFSFTPSSSNPWIDHHKNCCQLRMETGSIEVAKVRGKSTVVRCFSKYPLKFIVPNKVGTCGSDSVWVYTLTYGGGIVSGDTISCNFTIGDECTAVLTTQSSTKVYKSVSSKCSHQNLETRVGSGALFIVIPDPVTCFANARYSQKQVFRVQQDSNLVLVDWFTSGRYECGERWNFGLYRSANNILYEDDEPLLLDTVLLEQGSVCPIAERMQDYQVIAMVIILGPRLKDLQCQVQKNVKNMMLEYLQVKPSVSGRNTRSNSDLCMSKPDFVASCSAFGPKGVGVIVRVAATTTESVYHFLHLQLACLEPLLGASPYS